MPECRRKVSPASTFWHQGSVRYAGHGLVRHCPAMVTRYEEFVEIYWASLNIHLVPLGFGLPMIHTSKIVTSIDEISSVICANITISHVTQEYIQKIKVKSCQNFLHGLKNTSPGSGLSLEISGFGRRNPGIGSGNPLKSPQKLNRERILIYCTLSVLKVGRGGDFSGKQLPLYSVLKQG